MLDKSFVEELRNLFVSLAPQYVGKTHDIRSGVIKDDGTPVGYFDFYTMETLRELIKKRFPGDIIIGEEDNKSPEEIQRLLADTSHYQWTIDGLDGTRNRDMGLQHGAMLARKDGLILEFAAIFRPMDEILRGDGFFYAVNQFPHWQGAWQYCGEHKKYHRLDTEKSGNPEQIIVLLEGSSKEFFRPPIDELGPIFTTRPSLSTSVAATTVAMGKASALITKGNKIWDNHPPILLIKQAGGIVTDWQGKHVFLDNCSNIIAAANLEILEKILAVLKKAA